MGSFFGNLGTLGSHASISLKIKFFKASVLTVLLYATETYVINKTLEEKINIFQTQWLWIILNISQNDHVSNLWANRDIAPNQHCCTMPAIFPQIFHQKAGERPNIAIVPLCSTTLSAKQRVAEIQLFAVYWQVCQPRNSTQWVWMAYCCQGQSCMAICG